MRSFSAILFAVLLMLGQTLGISTPAFAEAAPPADCTCGKSCCITDAPTPAAPEPAAPLTSSQDHLSNAIPVSLLAWSLPAARASICCSFSSLYAHEGGIALYQRNCSYLI